MSEIQPHPRRILSIDGGGIKGVMAAAYLAHLEVTYGIKIYEHFDLIVGTSTGGIIALALGKGVPASEILRLYEDRGSAIFSKDAPASRSLLSNARQWLGAVGKSKHDPVALSREIKSIFGNTLIGESRTRLVVPSFIDFPAGPYLFKTAHHSELRSDYKRPMTDAAMATSAAPVFFPKHNLPTGEGLVDGGIWANNPIGVAALEAVPYLGWDHRYISILSLGYTSTIMNYPKNGGLLDFLWGGKIIELFMAGQEKMSMSTAKLLLPGARAEGRIIREQIPLGKDYFKMDDTTKINTLVGAGNAMARKAGPELLDKFFLTPCEPFNPFYKVETNDNQYTKAVA